MRTAQSDKRSRQLSPMRTHGSPPSTRNPPNAKKGRRPRHRGDEPAVVADAHTWFGATPSLPLPSVWDWLRIGSPPPTAPRAFANYVAHPPSTRHFVGAFAVNLGSLHFFYGCRTRVFLSIPSAWKVSTGSVLLATQKDYFWAFPTAGVATCSTHPTSARSGATEGTPWGGGEAAERRPAPGITGVLHRGQGHDPRGHHRCTCPGSGSRTSPPRTASFDAERHGGWAVPSPHG